MSKTDGILDVMGWRVATKPRPQLYVGPSRDFVTEQFEPRLMKLFDEAPLLAGLVARGKRNKKFRKLVNGVSVRLGWAGSATSLASDQAGDVYVDEYDKMRGYRKGTGDPFTLAKARADTYPDRKIAVTSTPERGRVECEACPDTGLEFWKVAPAEDLDSPIWAKWQSGTRHHWAWPCPHCGTFFIPRLRDLHVPEKPGGRPPTPFEARRETFMLCPSGNGCVIEEADKSAMNARGVFVAPGQHVTDSGEVEGLPPESSILSLWVSGTASPFVTWGERLEEAMLARDSGEPENIQGAVNKCGEVWAPVPQSAPKVEVVEARQRPYVMRDRTQGIEGEVPREAVRCVMTADVGLRDIHYVVRGFGSRASSYLLDAGKILGRTDGNDPWDALSDVLNDDYGGLRIQLALIDSGFRPDKKDQGDIHRVYDFVRRHAWVCKAAKGHAKRNVPLQTVKHEVTPNGKQAKFSIDLVHVDTDYFKSLVHTRLNTENDRPGSLGLPSNLPPGFANHLISEAREISDGKPTWVQLSKQNHWFDCEALAAVAGYMLNVQRLPPGVFRDWDASAPPMLGAARSATPAQVVRAGALEQPVEPVEAAVVAQAAVASKSLREALATRFAARSSNLRRR